MKNRLMISLAAGALLAAMLPGVASAAPDSSKGGPIFRTVIQCWTEAGEPLAISSAGPAGYSQADARAAFNILIKEECDPSTKLTIVTKVPA